MWLADKNSGVVTPRSRTGSSLMQEGRGKGCGAFGVSQIVDPPGWPELCGHECMWLAERNAGVVTPRSRTGSSHIQEGRGKGFGAPGVPQIVDPPGCPELCEHKFMCLCERGCVLEWSRLKGTDPG